MRSAGHEVVAVEDAEQALELGVSDPTLDLVVTDLNMPGLSGDELMRRLAEGRPNLRCLLISGGLEACEVVSPDDPYRGFLLKPFGRQIGSQTRGQREARAPTSATATT